MKLFQHSDSWLWCCLTWQLAIGQENTEPSHLRKTSGKILSLMACLIIFPLTIHSSHTLCCRSMTCASLLWKLRQGKEKIGKVTLKLSFCLASQNRVCKGHASFLRVLCYMHSFHSWNKWISHEIHFWNERLLQMKILLISVHLTHTMLNLKAASLNCCLLSTLRPDRSCWIFVDRENRDKMTVPARGLKSGYTTSHSSSAQLGSPACDGWEGGKMKEGVPAKTIVYLICLFLKKEETNICNYLVGIYVLIWNCLCQN